MTIKQVSKVVHDINAKIKNKSIEYGMTAEPGTVRQSNSNCTQKLAGLW